MHLATTAAPLPLPALRGDSPPVDIGREAAREAAERELSREIYTQHQPNIFQRAAEWVWDRLSDIFNNIGFTPPGGWAGLLLLAVIVTALVIALRWRFGALRTATGPGRKTLFTDSVRSAAEHRAAADQHAAAAQWRPAVQERMRALVRSLEERTILDPSPGRTADEAATETSRAMPALASQMREAARTFDAVTYGGAPATATDHHQLHQLDDELGRTRPQLHTTHGARS